MYFLSRSSVVRMTRSFCLQFLARWSHSKLYSLLYDIIILTLVKSPHFSFLLSLLPITAVLSGRISVLSYHVLSHVQDICMLYNHCINISTYATYISSDVFALQNANRPNSSFHPNLRKQTNLRIQPKTTNALDAHQEPQ